MAAERMDVLAVMDKAAGGIWPYSFALSDEVREARAAVAELVADLKRIQRRAVEHPDDNDADRKRNLYHVKSIADAALARMGEGA